MRRYGNVLGVWAHPDDESYLAAGFMMRALALGDRVACVTATRGEQGTTDPQRWPAGESLAKLRTAESAEAMRILGVTEHHWLDYPDGGLPEVENGEVLARLHDIASDLQPAVITTFSPAGMTGHPDHQTVSRWSTELAASLVPRPLVLHAVHEESVLDRNLPRLLELGIFMNGALPDSAPLAETVTVQLGTEELQRKWAALLAQPSQTERLFELAGPDLMRDMFCQESFVVVQED